MIPKINAAVLFVEDLDGCMRFYRDMLGLHVTFSDDVSFAFKLEDQDFVLLKLSARGLAVVSPDVKTSGCHKAKSTKGTVFQRL